MGFTIFESSGTFSPLDYGLVVGDLIHLVVVGGGGGGCGTANLYTAGNAGGASSFGNILTAAGGLAPSDNKFVSPTSGSFRGAAGTVQQSIGAYLNNNTTTPVANHSSFGGGGADGWLPGVFKGRCGMPSTIYAYSHALFGDIGLSCNHQDNYGHNVNFSFAVESLLSAIPASNQAAGSGGIFSDGASNSIIIGGAGGLGYGAGGGGGVSQQVYPNLAGAGGNSGVIAQKDYVLTNTNSVSVTVGVGGTGGTGYRGGDGANGCVAIFW